MQLRKKYVLALLASGMAWYGLHAEEDKAVVIDTESAKVEAALDAEIADMDKAAPTGSETNSSATLISAIQNAPDWTKDLANRIKVHGYSQGGYTDMSKGAKEHTNTFDIKRVLFWANAQITDRWSFLFMHDFSSVVQEFYTDYRLTNNKALTVRFGQFKNALSYENKLSPTGQEVIDVYADGVTYLTDCGSDPLFGVQYGRDLGLALFGETNDGKLRYEVNILNGTGVNKKDGNREKDFIGRLDFKPVKGLTLVASGQIGRGHAKAASLYCPDIQVGEDYKRNRWTAGFDYNTKPLHIHGEYLEGKDKNTTSRGAYLTGCVPIMADKLDFVGSYDFFNFNTDLKMDQHKAVAGLQYWFYKNCRFQVQYVYKNTYVENGVFRHGANHGVMCQMQIRFN